MNETALAIVLAGLTLLVPVAAAQPAGVGLPGQDSRGVGTLGDALEFTANHGVNMTDSGNATATTNATVTPNESTPTPEDTAGPDRVPPGATLAGVVSAQGAEVESDVDERTFDHRFNVSKSNRSKALAIATRQATLTDRLVTLRNRSAALERAHGNESIGEGRYRAAATALTAQVTALRRQVNRTKRASDELPRTELEAAGVNVTAVETLARSASELSGQDLRRIAHSIAGRDVGQSVADDRRPDHAGPPEDRGRNGRPGDEDRGNQRAEDRDESDDRGPPAESDRGRQNQSDDRSHRGDRGRNGAGSNVSDDSSDGAADWNADASDDAGDEQGTSDRANDRGDERAPEGAGQGNETDDDRGTDEAGTETP